MRIELGIGINHMFLSGATVEKLSVQCLVFIVFFI